MIKNVAIYCRVSTDEQKKFGISVNDQKNSLTEYCKRNNYKIYDYYIDEGISASTISKRKEFVRLLKDLDNIDLIIFTKLDRFSRNVRDANNLLVELDKHTTSFKAIDEDDIDTSTADGRFIFNLKVNLAEHERNKDSERINRINKYKYMVAKTVCSGQKIFGYDIVDKRLVINETEQEQIKELYLHYIKTNNLLETTKWFRTNIKNKSIGQVKNYLTDKKYIGIYQHKKLGIIEDFCPPLLDKELFDKVQKMVNKNIKNYSSPIVTKRVYVFSGLVRCKECGFKMSGGTRGKTAGYTKIYRCKQHFIENKCVNKTALTETYIEDYLKKNILSLANNYFVESTQKKKAVAKNNISSIKAKLDKLVDLYLNNIIDKDKYNLEYNTLQKELAIAEEKVKQDKNKTSVDNIKKFINGNFMEIYDTLTELEKQRLWRNIIDVIEIDNNKNIHVIFL